MFFADLNRFGFILMDASGQRPSIALYGRGRNSVDLLRKVPKGKVTTYKEIAHAMETKSYQGVGQAMRKNPYAPEVP